MTKEEAINTIIKEDGVDTNKISDGYHTFGELYEHRIELWITICRMISDVDEVLPNPGTLPYVYRSQVHSDGSKYDGWFILGLQGSEINQITYHLPMSKWSDCSFAKTLEIAPPWDGHKSEDVLKRLRLL